MIYVALLLWVGCRRGSNFLLLLVLTAAAMTVFEMDLDPLDTGPNSEVQQMINANTEMFQMTAYLKFRIPVHKWFITPSWKRLVEAEDCLVRYLILNAPMATKVVYFSRLLKCLRK